MDKTMPLCWCGDRTAVPFSEAYVRCPSCETLISKQRRPPASRPVRDDDKDFYGKNYWFTHQESDLDYPNIRERARCDLEGRCLRWLDTLLRYRLPPGDILEVGSAHGGFVALLQWAGFRATGLELSPWVVEFARKTFGVPVLEGPVETQDLPVKSLDVIVMMDVLEHFPDPVGTIKRCLSWLKRDGFLFIQTPRYPAGNSYEELAGRDDRFLEQLKAEEHLHLFSEGSLRELFTRVGLSSVMFTPAVFSHYDMAAIAGRKKPAEHSPPEIQSALIESPQGRLVHALLRLKDHNLDLRKRAEGAASDHASLSAQVEELTGLLRESEKDRGARMEQITQLSTSWEESETDRKARLDQIGELTSRLEASEKDRKARGSQIGTLTKRLERSETDRKARMAQIKKLTGLLKRSEGDRDARALQIEQLDKRFMESEADREARLTQIQALTGWLKESERDRADRKEQLDRASLQMKAGEIKQAEDLRTIETQSGRIADLEARIAEAREKAAGMERALNRLESTRVVRAARKTGLIKIRQTQAPAGSGGRGGEGSGKGK